VVTLLTFRFLRKIAKINYYCHHIYLSVCVPHKKLANHWTDFHKILYLWIFRKYFREDSSFTELGEE